MSKSRSRFLVLFLKSSTIVKQTNWTSQLVML